MELFDKPPKTPNQTPQAPKTGDVDKTDLVCRKIMTETDQNITNLERAAGACGSRKWVESWIQPPEDPLLRRSQPGTTYGYWLIPRYGYRPHEVPPTAPRVTSTRGLYEICVLRQAPSPPALSSVMKVSTIPFELRPPFSEGTIAPHWQERRGAHSARRDQVHLCRSQVHRTNMTLPQCTAQTPQTETHTQTERHTKLSEFKCFSLLLAHTRERA